MAERNKLSSIVKMKNFENIFAKTSSYEERIDNNGSIVAVENSVPGTDANKITELLLNTLMPFAEHPFKLYKGKKLDDMVESIKENGIMTPLIVRRKDDGKYEILSGHNRANAAKIAGLDVVPAIIKEGMSDAEAKIIVIDTNFMQRSITDMFPSELAKSLKMQLEACKEAKQKRAFVNDIENSESICEINTLRQGVPVEHSLRSRDIIADNNKMSAPNVRRYIRLNYLTDNLLTMVDEDKFSLRTAVDLSYLKENEQESVLNVLNDYSFKVDMAKAETLRNLSKSGKLNEDTIFTVLSGEFSKKRKSTKPVSKKIIKISFKKLTPYFDRDVDEMTMEDEIVRALEFYRQARIEKQNESSGEVI